MVSQIKIITMKKFFRNPTTIVFLFFAAVLIGSNVCCTGHASNNDKNSTAVFDKNNNTNTETNTGNITTLTESTFDDNIKSGIVLVDFWATWCRPSECSHRSLKK